MKQKRIVKFILWPLLYLFLLMNIVAYFHAYKFTHFSEEDLVKTKANSLSITEKIEMLFFGIKNPKPKNNSTPAQEYETIQLQSSKTIECWNLKTENPKGTIILFHGYGGKKSSMLDKAEEFLKLGYTTMLVDFMGSGGSEGSQTTIGFKEAGQVKTCFEYIKQKDAHPVYLFGTSMGAVAILKAIRDHNINPTGIIIECPFGSMYETTCARFKIMNVPTFPMAGLLVFWGGVQNGFWAFSHKPTEYAKKVKCPTLLLYGEQDTRVSREEIDEIYNRDFL